MKSFSELTSASQVNNEDLVAISQASGGGYASKKTTVKDITDKSNLNLAEEYDSTSTYAVDDYVIYESVLYKCIATTTGTFDSTKWTSVVVTDEMGSGGGGGTGGHTIIDENGNSMTARSGLQFFGAVEVTDDSANNRTLVEVLGGDFYNPVIYSTEEREIGVWTDGKPLYQKTYTATITSGTQWIDTGLDSGDVIVESKGVLLQNNGDILTLASGDSGVNAGINSMSVGIVTSGKWAVLFRTNNNDARGNLTLTLLYTKGTDTAGSGTWTPQGVPTHHYSTDEQVIGTWIDGSTLYEKTIDCGSVSAGSQKILAHNISNFGRLVNVFGAAYNSSDNGWNTIPRIDNDATYQRGIKVDNTNIYVLSGSNVQALTNCFVTIQYTKSS